MSFYDLNKEERKQLVENISKQIFTGLSKNKDKKTLEYFSDDDTYIRKTAYLAIGKMFFEYPEMQDLILQKLDKFFRSENEKVRQSAINAAGEIGKKNFEVVEYFFSEGLFDPHHSPRNAVIGSIKKMGEKNPKPVLKWAKKFLHHEDKEVRREICHGIELRGRKFPQDILPMLKELQFDKTGRVRNTLVHVLGQIAYKKGCLATVIDHLHSWENKELAKNALDGIIDVHDRYKDFAAMTQTEAVKYIEQNFKEK